MRDSNNGRHRASRRWALALVLATLWGCGGAPQKEPEPTAPPPEEPVKQGPVSLELPPSRHTARFEAAESALGRFDWMSAEVTLADVSVDQTSPDDRAYLAYLQGRIDFIRGDQQAALAQLQTVNTPGTHPALRYRILSFQQHMLSLSRDYLQAAHAGDQLLLMSPGASAPAWKRQVWRNLQRANTADLQSALAAPNEPRWHAWLELAATVREEPYPAAAALEDWRRRNPVHPAANPLPGGLDYRLASGPQGGKVALMLPLSGRLAPAGKAVLDGYLAAYYAARERGDTPFELLIMDLGRYVNANEAYDDAVSRGARMVVGPLSKQAVGDLATRLDRPVPTLTLNRVDEVLPGSGNAMVQASLAPEDEVERLAELAYGEGARSIMIITPRSDSGDKLGTILRKRWTALGGSIASTASYDTREDYSASVKNALGLSASEARAGQVRDMLADNIEFTPRRRQDPDAIFLLSRNGEEARSIKPLLAFHYAGTLPVYAVSSIYNGIQDDRNRDLNGIRLVETPWLLGANPGLRAAIAAADSGAGNYPRLNALGADAFLLQSGFPRLQSGPDALFRGNTGLLSMDPQLRIRRELSAATFDGGIIQPR